jgi:cytoskeletal protein CcmA (bactofilin family)
MDSQNTPAPEALKPQDASSSSPASPSPAPKKPNPLRRGTYRPSHKATFVAMIVVALILGINAGIIGFIIKKQAASNTPINNDQVTVSQSALSALGVNRNSVGNNGVVLVVGPSAKFNNEVQVGGDVSIAGSLKLNSKFTASDASLAKLEAGDTSVNSLNVNGAATASTLSLRSDLAVTGSTHFQGAVTTSQLLTVNNNLNVTGSVAIGGVLSVNSFHAASLAVDSTITIGGHVITSGSRPGVSAGPGVGSNGTVSISGNDQSGTVAVNTGVGAGGGIVANITFHNRYSNIPHVVVTAVGPGTGVVYVFRTTSGFSIGVNGALSPGGYAFDYIVEQ